MKTNIVRNIHVVCGNETIPSVTNGEELKNMKKPSEIFKSGKMSDLTPDHVWVIVSGLYRANLAKAWFIGMGWPEGFHYCESREYVLKTAAPIMLEKNLRALWFAVPMVTPVTIRKK